MPLFTYKCDNCDNIIEKFMHSADDEMDKCVECDGLEFTRIFSPSGSRVRLDANDMFNNVIKPDADRIQDKINKGSDKDFLDLIGE